MKAVASVAAVVAVAAPAKAAAHVPGCDSSRCDGRVGHKFSVVRPYRAVLAKIRRCESTDNPRAVSDTGKYRGYYQFDLGTWRTVGGWGDPARASRLEQHYRASLLLRRRGTQPWPVCGR